MLSKLDFSWHLSHPLRYNNQKEPSSFAIIIPTLPAIATLCFVSHMFRLS